jgi:hypothetical protein
MTLTHSNSGNSGNTIIWSQLLNIILTKYMKLDMTTAMMLSGSLISILNPSWIIDTMLVSLGSRDWSIKLTLIIMASLLVIAHRRGYLMNGKYSSCTFYSPGTLINIVTYLHDNNCWLNDHHFQRGWSDSGSSNMEGFAQTFMLPKLGHKMTWKCLQTQCHGYVYFDKDEHIKPQNGNGNGNNQTVYTTYYVTLGLNNTSKLSIDKFVEACRTHTNKLKIQLQCKTYHFSTDILDDCSRTFIYQGRCARKNDHLSDRRSKFMDTYFHPQRDALWTKCYSVRHHVDMYHSIGQVPFFNGLLYGPKGSGKSSFVSRVAKVLATHITNINIMGYLQNKSSLFHLVFNALINENIIMFEEFDFALKKLKEAEEFNDRMRQQESKFVVELDDHDDDSDVFAMTKKRKEFFKNSQKCENNMTYGDLLQLLSGPSTVDGSLIFASTNDMLWIEENCPTLIRAKRMTPIFMGYHTSDTLNRMCYKYFFNRIELLIDSKNNNDSKNQSSKKDEAIIPHQPLLPSLLQFHYDGEIDVATSCIVEQVELIIVTPLMMHSQESLANDDDQDLLKQLKSDNKINSVNLGQFLTFARWLVGKSQMNITTSCL